MNPIATMWLYPFAPRRVVRAHVHTPLWQVYVIHLLGVLWLVVVLAGLDVLNVAAPWLADGELVRVVGDGYHWDRPPTSVAMLVLHDLHYTGVALLLLACGEAVCVVMAAFMLCWAGGRGRVRDAWVHSLRCSWLHVAQLPYVAVGWIGSIILMSTYALDNQLTPPALVLSATAVWSIGCYVRALTLPYAPRPAPEADAPAPDPLCEWCGYNLSNLPEHGNCPECGRAILDSVQCDRRAFDRPFNPETFLATWFTCESQLRSITAHTRSAAMTRYYWLNMVFTGWFAWGALIASVAFMVGEGLPPNLDVALSTMLAITGFVGFVFMLFTCGLASLHGVLASRRVGRCRLTAALQVVGLMSSACMPWPAAGVCCLFFAGSVLEMRMPTVFPLWFLAHVIVALVFNSAVTRGMRFVQYANR